MGMQGNMMTIIVIIPFTLVTLVSSFARFGIVISFGQMNPTFIIILEDSGFGSES